MTIGGALIYSSARPARGGCFVFGGASEEPSPRSFADQAVRGELVTSGWDCDENVAFLVLFLSWQILFGT